MEKDIIFMVEDRFSKFAHFMPLKHPFTEATVAQYFLRMCSNYVHFQRPLCAIVILLLQTDFGLSCFSYKASNSILVSLIIGKQMVKLKWWIRLTWKCIYLKCITSESPIDWVKWLPRVEYVYNTSAHSARGGLPTKWFMAESLQHYFPRCTGQRQGWNRWLKHLRNRTRLLRMCASSSTKLKLEWNFRW